MEDDRATAAPIVRALLHCEISEIFLATRKLIVSVSATHTTLARLRKLLLRQVFQAHACT
jgi:hypothetical protein